MFSNLQPFDDLKAFQDFRLYPLFIGATLFAFEAPGLVTVKIFLTIPNLLSELL